MEKRAYDSCYLDMMIQKGRYLFKLIGRNAEDVFYTIEAYMTGDYRKHMDMGNPLYLNKTPKQILGEMKIQIDEQKQENPVMDEFILEWMSDIYTYMQWSRNIPSAEIVSVIKPEELYRKYYPLHETSVENGVEKLCGIYGFRV